MACYHKQNRPE